MSATTLKALLLNLAAKEEEEEEKVDTTTTSESDEVEPPVINDSSNSSSIGNSNDYNSCPLLAQQRIMAEYHRLYTPYRGLIIQHQYGPGLPSVALAVAAGKKLPQKKVTLLTFLADETELKTNLLNLSADWDKKNTNWFRHLWTDTGIETQVEELVGKENLAALKRDNPYGAYLPKAGLPPNYQQLQPKRQQMLDTQLRYMTNYRYSVVSMNTIQKTMSASFKEGQNPFNDQVVIIDEADKFIEMVDLYNAIMHATNSKIIVCLPGTPVIGHNLALLFNLIRGKITSYFFPLKTNLAESEITNTLRKVKNDQDLFTYDPITKLVKVMRNPMGLLMKDVDDKDKISTKVIQLLTERGLEVDKLSKMETKALFPEKKEDFLSQYIETVNNGVEQFKNPVIVKRLIAGLVAVLSANKNLVPEIVPQVLKAPLSDLQMTAINDNLKKDDEKYYAYNFAPLPNTTDTAAPENKIDEPVKDNAPFKDELHLYSPKYAYLLRKLAKKESGKHVVFSSRDFLVLERVLIAHGYVKLAFVKDKQEELDFGQLPLKKWLKKPKFVILQNEELDEVSQTLYHIYNCDWAKVPAVIQQQLNIKKGHYITDIKDPDYNENMLLSMRTQNSLGLQYGKICLLPQKSGALHLPLSHIRHIHILEPPTTNAVVTALYNHVRFLCCFSESIQQIIYISTSKTKNLLEETNYKTYLINEQTVKHVNDLLQMSAVDCAAGYKRCFDQSMDSDDKLSVGKQHNNRNNMNKVTAAKAIADKAVEEILKLEEQGLTDTAVSSSSSSLEPRKNINGDLLYVKLSTGTWYTDAAGKYPVINPLKHFYLANKVREYIIHTISAPHTLQFAQNSQDDNGQIPEAWLHLLHVLEDNRARFSDQQLSVSDKQTIVEMVDTYKNLPFIEPAFKNGSRALYEILAELQLQPINNTFFNWEPKNDDRHHNSFIEAVKLFLKGDDMQWCAAATAPTPASTNDHGNDNDHDNDNDEKWTGADKSPSDLTNHVHRFFPDGCSLYTCNDAYVSDKDLFSQVYTGLRSLVDGGHLIIRQHMFDTPFRRSLIALTAFFFTETHIIKPLASNPVLADVFLVGRNFRLSQLTEQVITDLETILKQIESLDLQINSILVPDTQLLINNELLAAAQLIYMKQQVLYMTIGVTLFKQGVDVPTDYYDKQGKYWLAKYYI